MTTPNSLISMCALLPAMLMAAASLATYFQSQPTSIWKSFHRLSHLALLAALVTLVSMLGGRSLTLPSVLPGLMPSLSGAWLVLLVQILGTVIGAFSARYLEGELGQQRYVRGLAGVLSSVHLLLLADHWLVLIAAWSATGLSLQTLLCFYPERPFAQLAALKKRIADRLADGLLIIAAALSWLEIGSGSLSALKAALFAGPASLLLHYSAICLVLAVILRTALLPVHGWLIQVMEAPTPVSALLHAGVVNLGGFVLISFAPLLHASPWARGLLVVMGLASALLAGLVMLTRVSIKVRLAWSTVAQMGFMLLECGLGLYSLALLHLIGHSLYKAHAFLAASSIVRHTRLQALRGSISSSRSSLLAAPLLAALIVVCVLSLISPQLVAIAGTSLWPWWWIGVLSLAWAPLLWLPTASYGNHLRQGAAGSILVAGLTLLASLAHTLPLGVSDALHADHAGGLLALAGMFVLYLCLALLQSRPQALEGWRRWSYAGFYIDEFYTRLALRLSPRGWAPATMQEIPNYRQSKNDAPTISSQ